MCLIRSLFLLVAHLFKRGIFCNQLSKKRFFPMYYSLTLTACELHSLTAEPTIACSGPSQLCWMIFCVNWSLAKFQQVCFIFQLERIFLRRCHAGINKLFPFRGTL